jgi:hypothetical protein
LFSSDKRFLFRPLLQFFKRNYLGGAHAQRVMALKALIASLAQKGECGSFFSGYARKMNHLSSFFANEASKKDPKTGFD